MQTLLLEQRLHADWPVSSWKVPGRQSIAAMEPAAHEVPRGQATHASMLMALVAALKKPPGQTVAFTLPAGQ